MDIEGSSGRAFGLYSEDSLLSQESEETILRDRLEVVA